MKTSIAPRRTRGLLVSLLLAFFASSYAQQLVAGSISGRVTDGNGDPPSGFVVVTAFRFQNGSWDDQNSTNPDSNGEYRIPALTTGTYRVCFFRLNKVYVLEECYDHAADLDAAADVSVTLGQDTGGINGVVDPSDGSISGRLTDGNGDPAASVSVSAFRLQGGSWIAENSARSNANGAYQIPTLPVGTYRVCFESQQYVDECYDDAIDIDSATDVAVTLGQDTGGIDGVLDEQLHPPQPEVIPTLSEWALLLLCFLLVAASVTRLRLRDG